uniref:NADH-ubiquinone oxidoreductase chain 4L n=1 Tax=Byctiscus populi TaxID=1069883 RepID=J9PHU6_BYCPO|nr:NADH dehydrogenase subunit 4L [Byctiscus populi]
MMMSMIVSVFMFLSGLLSFSMKRKHLLLMLLSIEMVVVSLYMNLFIFLSLNDYEYFFSMIFLSMSVCEGALGLSVLVMMIRSYGNDYMMAYSSLW